MQAWLSDLHIGVKDHPADDFGGHEREVRFYEALANLSSLVDTVGLNGDTFELWQFGMGEILDSRSLSLQAIKQFVDVIVRGNHDSGLPDTILDTEVVDSHKEDGLTVMHGHQFDTFNSPPFNWIGKSVAQLGKIGEMEISSDIDVLFHNMQLFLNNGRYGTNKKYFDKVRDEYPHTCACIVGHTHEAYANNCHVKVPQVWNTGTWTNGNTDILIISKDKKDYYTIR